MSKNMDEAFERAFGIRKAKLENSDTTKASQKPRPAQNRRQEHPREAEIYLKLLEIRGELDNLYGERFAEKITALPVPRRHDLHNNPHGDGMHIPEGRKVMPHESHLFFQLGKDSAISIGYDPDKKVFKLHKLRPEYETKMVNKRFGDSVSQVEAPKNKHVPGWVSMQPADYFTAKEEYFPYESFEELKEDVTLIFDKAHEKQIERAPSRLAKIFGAIIVAGGVLYACSSDAAEWQSDALETSAPQSIFLEMHP